MMADIRLQAQESSMPERLNRYNDVTQIVHWITALLIFTTLPVAWIMQSMTHGARRDVYVDAHKSIGITILLLTMVRLLWRVRCGAPRELLSPILSVLAKSSHWALYVLLLAMPLTGYIQSAATDHAAAFFWLVQIPPLPHNQTVGDAALFIHNVLRWPLYALIALHLLAVLVHVAWLRDSTLERMLPAQKHLLSGSES
jgi:cytochrome b561